MYGISRSAAVKALQIVRTRTVGSRQVFQYQKLGLQQQKRNACGFSTVCKERNPHPVLVDVLAFSSFLMSCMVPWGYFLSHVPDYQKRDDDIEVD